MTVRDLAGARAAFAAAVLAVAALVGWLSGSIAWGLVMALAAFIAWHAIQFRSFARWSRRPLGRPASRDAAWAALADRLYRAIGIGRTRSRGLVTTLRRLRTTTDTIPDGWVILRLDGEIEDYNRGARDRLGLSANDHGQNLVALVRNPGIVSLLRGEVDSDIVEIAAPADETRRIELRRIDIDAERALVMARDVTELNRLLTMRQDFVANVSHELRTPLTVIVGYLEELGEGDPDFETLRDVLPKLTPPARRMRALVDDLLTLTRLESAPLPSDETTEDIEVALMLDTIVAEARQLSAGMHDIVLHANPDLRLRGVSTELYSAFNNLVTNAVRYSPDGGTIDVRWYESAAGPRFEVADRGMGIAPEHLTRITERFYRIDLAGARVRGGTGLGLAIVKHVLRRHRSVLQVESELAKGSLFYCVFGADQARDDDASEAPTRAVGAPETAARPSAPAAGAPPPRRQTEDAGAGDEPGPAAPARPTSETHDGELESLRRLLMEMGGLVERQLRTAGRAFVTHDTGLAEDVRTVEAEVNRIELALDAKCVRIIARRQPVARDLRLLVAIMKAGTDLERVGDEACKIARLTEQAATFPIPDNGYAGVQHMRNLVSGMLNRTLDAFARLDLEAAYDVIATDADVDDGFLAIDRALSREIAEQSEYVQRSVNTLWTARALERIGDHAKNISEYVVYVIRGEDVRHPGSVRSQGSSDQELPEGAPRAASGGAGSVSDLDMRSGSTSGGA